MRLSRVDIKGFKSIAKKTVLTFPGQVTCICGPNGCGKSNVIDAIRWAIGEQSTRTLRAGNMSDVIFSGTQETPQAGLARVSLEFSRDGGYWPASLDGFETIAVARRLYRTGESSYTINDVKCRLKDVADLFMDTGLTRHGYAIIGQGRIKDIIQAKPEDIRYLIEEAADVGRFRLKRAEALRRMEAASANLERIQDLLTEIAKQRNTLKNQAAKARRYQELRDEHNQLTLRLWSHELAGLDRQQAAADQALKALELNLEHCHSRDAAATAIHAQIASAGAELKAHLDEGERALQAERSQLELAASRLAAGQTRLEDLRTNQDRLAVRIAASEAELNQSQTQLAEAASDDGRFEGQVELALSAQELSQAALRQSEARAAEIDAVFEQGRSALFEILSEQRASEQRASAAARRQQETTASLSRRSAELAELDRTAAELSQAQTAAQTASAELDTDITALRASLDQINQLAAANQAASEAAVQQLMASEKAEAETRAKLSMLERLLKRDAPQSGERLRGVIKPKPGFEETVGRALGNVLDYALVEDHAAISATDGCPGFIPRETFSSATPELEGAGLIAPLFECLMAENEPAARSVTQNHWVVENLAAASAIWRASRPAVNLVTLDGLVLEPSGVVRNSSARHGELLKATAEQAELLEKCGPLGLACAAARAAIAEQRAQLKTITERQQTLRARLGEAERQHQRLQAKTEELNGRLERLAARRQSFTSELDAWRELQLKLEQEQQLSSSQQADLNATLSARQQALQEIETRRAASRQQLEAARQTLDADTARLGEARLQLATLRARHQSLQAERQRREAELAADRERIHELAATAASITAQLEQTREQHAHTTASLSARQQAQAELVPELAAIEARLANQDLELGEVRQQIAALEQQRGQLKLEGKECEIARRMRLERLQARFGGNPAELEPDFDAAAAQLRAAEVQTVIEGLGQINFTSIEAHEEAQSRYEEIHRQYEDLIQATAKLKEVISGCERESNKAFMATFVKVRSNFQEIFATMFDGGQADLILRDDPEDGVEICACPPHKKPRTMSLLSEGEKTLCALSFIFALFKVKPSPFCVMDEVDAPLDDANVERMLRLIRSFAGDTQFLVVTHNRRTMEMADIIYGVTFDVPGITKVISINLKDADEQAA